MDFANDLQTKAESFKVAFESHQHRQTLQDHLTSLTNKASSLTDSYQTKTEKLHQLQRKETELVNALASIRENIAGSRRKSKAIENETSSVVEDMKLTTPQLVHSADHDDIFKFLCERNTRVLNQCKLCLAQIPEQ